MRRLPLWVRVLPSVTEKGTTFCLFSLAFPSSRCYPNVHLMFAYSCCTVYYIEGDNCFTILNFLLSRSKASFMLGTMTFLRFKGLKAILDLLKSGLSCAVYKTCVSMGLVIILLVHLSQNLNYRLK